VFTTAVENNSTTGAGARWRGGGVRGSDIIVEMLIEYGVEHVFGVAGDTSISLYESLHERQDRITHVLCRDERSASYAADAYARLTFKPGLCESPSGGSTCLTINAWRS